MSVLCSVDVAVIIFGHNKKLYEYSSGDIQDTIARFQYVSKPRTGSSQMLILRSMAVPTSTKAQVTSTVGQSMRRTKTRWDLRRLTTGCQESRACLHICKIRVTSEQQPHPRLRCQTGCPTECRCIPDKELQTVTWSRGRARGTPSDAQARI